MIPIVSITIFLPLLGALFVMGLRKAPAPVVQGIGIGISGLALAGATWMWTRGVNATGFAQVEQFDWMPTIGAAYRVGVDGISLPLILLSAVLFFLVGMLQDRAHTREMSEFGGLLKVVPILGWSFVLAAFASLGLPGLAHFPAEFQIFLATLRVEPVATIVILGIVITAGLYLRDISAVFLGEPGKKWASMPDLSLREVLAVGPLLILTIMVGIAPYWVLNIIHKTTSMLPF